MAEWIKVCSETELTPGNVKVIDVDDVMIAIFNVDNEYYAIEDICTHDGEPLATGPICGSQVACPRHGAKFCIKTGEALTPPAFEPVTTFPTQVVDGIIQVQDNRWD